MTQKHTPGPWVADLGEAFHIREQDGGRVAQLVFTAGRYGMKGRRNGDEVAANARLIAAAPELLAALKMAQLWLDIDGRYDMQTINAAIAKAEGAS